MKQRIAEVPLALRILRLLLYVVGVLSIFWYFFSFIGVLIGVMLFLLPHRPRWRLHGIVLALCAAISEFVAHRATALEPLHLSMRSGPVILAAYLLISLFMYLVQRSTGNRPFFPEGLRNLRRRARVPLTIFVTLIPVYLWTVVSIHPAVVLDNSPKMLWVNAPSRVHPGEEFEFSVQAWDSFERLSAVYRGTVRFSLDSYGHDGSKLVSPVEGALPGEYTFSGRRRGSDIAYRIRDGNDNGRHLFRARIDTPGLHYLLVYDSETRNTFYSNPIEVGLNDERIFWGDIHSHSGLSDGSGSAAHSFFYARQVARLDFYALTDHGEILMLTPGGFNRLERATNKAYDPKRFVTFHGIEWTQVKTGHYTCIFSGDRLIKKPRLSYLTVPTAEGLWDVLDGFTGRTNCRALALPHHSTQKSYMQDWTRIDPKYVKLAEVTSVHGEFLFEQRHPLNYRGAIDAPPEYIHGSSIVDALRMGKRMILYAASDEHDGHPGHSLSHTAASIGYQRPLTRWHPRIGHPYPGGLTAVHARDLTREAVFSALEQGRVFACSDHGRPLLEFTVNDVSVGFSPRSSGSDVECSEFPAARRIEIFLAQDGSPAAARDRAASEEVIGNWRPDWRARVEIIRNGVLLASIQVDGPVRRLEYVDRPVATGTSYGREECVQRDGLSYINRYSDNPIDPDTLHTGGTDFYLVRVVSQNGRTAYAGPIWVEP